MPPGEERRGGEERTGGEGREGGQRGARGVDLYFQKDG